jgi:hypothetical protein
VEGRDVGEATVEATIERPAEIVWAAVRDYGNIDWHGGIENCVVHGDIRTVTMVGLDMEVDEQLLHHDDAERSYSYAVVAFRGETKVQLPDGSIFDSGAIAGHHRAGIRVFPIDGSSTRVEYWLELDEGFDGGTEASSQNYLLKLLELKSQLEG